MLDDAAPRPIFVDRNRNFLLGCLSVALFFAIWQAVFFVVPLNQLFISKPSLIALGLLIFLSSTAVAPFIYTLF